MIDWFVVALLALAVVSCAAGYMARMIKEMGE